MKKLIFFIFFTIIFTFDPSCLNYGFQEGIKCNTCEKMYKILKDQVSYQKCKECCITRSPTNQKKEKTVSIKLVTCG
jgi:hypothetical protein